MGVHTFDRHGVMVPAADSVDVEAQEFAYLAKCDVEFTIHVKHDGVGESKLEQNHQEGLGIDHCAGLINWLGNCKNAYPAGGDEEALVASEVQTGANGISINV